MKRLRMFLFAVLCAAVMFSGCAKDDEDNLSPTEFDKRGTLFGCIFDAITGAPIKGDDTMKVYLVQGETIRTPTKLITSATDDNAGEYAFDNIPVALYSGNKTYKIKVVKSGYQTFVGIVSFAAMWNNPGVGGAGNQNFETTRIDNSYNLLGNIYLFPVSTTAGDVKITVKTPAGELVTGATVRLQQNIAGNLPYAELGNRLAASAGYMTNFSATTDSTGVATFDDTTLVLGGSYTYRVDPITFNNQQLTQTAAAAVNIVLGVNNVNQTISLTAVTAEPNPLYVDVASNSTPGTVDSTGVLTLTFNQAINLSFGYETSFTGTLSGTAVYDTGAGYNPITLCNITAALSNSNKTLTLTPKFSTYETTAGATVTYTYAAGTIYVKNTQAAAGGFAALTDKYGAAISRVVRLKAW